MYCSGLCKCKLFWLEPAKPLSLTPTNMHTTPEKYSNGSLTIEQAGLKRHLTPAFSFEFLLWLIVCYSTLTLPVRLCSVESYNFYKTVTPARYCTTVHKRRHVPYLTAWRVYSDIHQPEIGPCWWLEATWWQAMLTEHARLCVRTTSCGCPLIATVGPLSLVMAAGWLHCCLWYKKKACTEWTLCLFFIF